MISHFVQVLEPEGLAAGGAGHAQLLDDRFVLTSPLKIKINYSLHACTSHVKTRNDGIFESTYLLYAAAALTPATTRQGGPKFGREHLLHLSICNAPTGEECDELLRGVNPVRVEGEKTAVLATDVTGQALLLSFVIDPGRAVVTYERLDRGHEWYNEI